MQKVCGQKCALSLVRSEKEKVFNKETTRRKKEILDGDSRHWLKKAQKEFNLFIRNRDKDQPCISCDREIVEQTIGGQWDCGHYRSVGAQPAIRFNELNAHKQCKSCNGGSSKYARKGETVASEYRVRLIKKIGLVDVEWLDTDHGQPNFKVDDYKKVFKKYQSINKGVEQADSWEG